MGRRKKYYHRWDSEGSIGKKGEGNGEEWAYVKPLHGGPTMHLMVTGPQPWLTRIHDIVKADGGCNAVYISDLMKPDDVHFFISFDSKKDSQDAKGVLEGMNEGLIAPSFPAELSHDSGDDQEEEEDECVSMAAQGHRKKKKARMPRIAVHYAEVEVRQQGCRDGEPEMCRAEIDPDACDIPGLIVVHDFITAEEEQELLDVIDGGVWDRLARRRVQHYGAKFSYATRTVDTSSEVPRIPEKMSCLLDRITAQGNISDTLDQITVNEYPVGVGLSPHVDTHSAFGDAIASLSLSEGVTMVFRRDGEQRAVYLPRRSLLVMGGESRWAWEHYIPHRKSDVLVDGHRIQRQRRRVSLTCRSIRHGPCQCPFPEYCDSQLGEIPPTRIGMNHDKAEDTSVAEPVIEKGHVQQVYNAIAPHFSATRFAIWPRVKEFIESIQYGGIVADVGCGNGKYFGIRQDLFVCGSDISHGLASLASKRIAPSHTSHGVVACPKADVCIADGLHTPYCDASCDAALSIAVIHHLSSVQRRVALIDEITRILRVGGRAIITAWATEQENMKKLAKWEPIDAPDPEHDVDGYTTANDYLVPWHVPMHRIGASSLREAGEIDRDRNSIKFKRYYHLFAPGELDRLVELSRQSTLVDAFYDRDNWCIVIEKKPPTYA